MATDPDSVNSDATAPFGPLLDQLNSRPSRTWSIVITVFGDAVVPRGGSLWLGSLLDIFAGMAIGGGAVRTAMFRLTTDGWLERSRVGRNSFYRLTEKGQLSSAQAAARIYAGPTTAWDGRLRLLLPGVDRDAGRLALAQAGFGLVPPGVWVAPLSLPVPADAAAMAQITGTMDVATGRAMAAQAWALGTLAQAYSRFVALVAPLDRWLAEGKQVAGLAAVIARTLLIHEYRRIVLRDPLLPLVLLPQDWPGVAAWALCRRVYAALLPPSEAWLDQNGLSEAGPLQPPLLDLFSRF